MKNKIYYTLKIVLGVFIAFEISNFLNISHPISAGIIAILSIRETRQESFFISLKRIIAGNIALIITFLIYYIAPFRLEFLVLVLIIFIPIALILKAKESIISGLVLSSHVYSAKELSISLYLEENIILLIGISVGFLLMLYVPDLEKEIIENKKNIEKSFKKVMLDMSYNLKNLCFLEEEVNLKKLEKEIKKAKIISQKYYENNLFKKQWGYITYFQMRLIQLYRLMYMQNHFRNIFITQQQAVPLSHITKHIAFSVEKNVPIEDILNKINELKTFYKSEPLPNSRIEFENRSVLFQYLNDLEEFILIKRRYLN